MHWQSVALAIAGLIGCGTAIMHGSLLQTMIIRPLVPALAADGQLPAPVRGLVPLLLHFTTFNWLLSGLLLLVSAFWFGGDARLVTALFSGSSFLFGALGAFSAIRAPHPSWMLMALAVILTLAGVSGGA